MIQSDKQFQLKRISEKGWTMPKRIISSNLEFLANGGTTPGYLSRPEGEGLYAGVVLIQEWWGLEEHILDVTRRFAGEGFVTLAPDLYHGQVTSEPTDAMKLAQGMDRDRAMKELNGAVSYLKSLPFTTDKVGVIGFCMGGALSMSISCLNRDLDACVVFYGGNPSPLELLQSMSCPLLGLYGDLDQRQMDSLPDLRTALDLYGKKYDIHVYPNSHHGFFNDTKPAAYGAESAKDAWEKVLGFFSANLG